MAKASVQNRISGLPEPQELVLHRLEDGREHTVEELIELTPGMSWAQLFIAMDNLSRCGSVELRRRGFTYWLRKAEPPVEGAERTDAAAHPHHR